LFLASQKSCFLETEVAWARGGGLANDEVIEQVDLQDSRTSRNSFREMQIRFRRTCGA
jgi:hypothetical protein